MKKNCVNICITFNLYATLAMKQTARLLEEVTTRMEAKTPSMSTFLPATTQKTFLFIVKQSQQFIERPFNDDADTASRTDMMSNENQVLKKVNVINASVTSTYALYSG